VAAGLVCAVQAQSAGAGTYYGDLDLRYTATTQNWTELPGRSTQHTYDPCFGSERLAGIGAWVSESVPKIPDHAGFALGKAYNVAIRPFDLIAGAPAPDANEQVADNLFKVNNSLILGEATVCADSLELTYPDHTNPSPKRSRNTAKVTCSGDRHVISGGGLASGPFRSQRLVMSAPFDSNDAGKKPDDGWRVAVDNLKRKRRKVVAYAICADVPGISYVIDAFGAKKRARDHVSLNCPADQFALGGGITHDIPYRKATLVASRYAAYPNFDGWFAEVDNLSRKRASGTVFAICHA
jgi:hypothetical protein